MNLVKWGKFPRFCVVLVWFWVFESDLTSSKTNRENTVGLPQTHLFPLLAVMESQKAFINKHVCPTPRRVLCLCRGNARLSDLWKRTSSGKGLLSYFQAAQGGEGFRGDRGGARSPVQGGD